MGEDETSVKCGMMCDQLAAELLDRIAAIAPVFDFFQKHPLKD